MRPRGRLRSPDARSDASNVEARRAGLAGRRGTARAVLASVQRIHADSAIRAAEGEPSRRPLTPRSACFSSAGLRKPLTADSGADAPAEAAADAARRRASERARRRRKCSVSLIDKESLRMLALQMSRQVACPPCPRRSVLASIAQEVARRRHAARREADMRLASRLGGTGQLARTSAAAAAPRTRPAGPRPATPCPPPVRPAAAIS